MFVVCCVQVVYFTALFPYAVMIIFFGRAVTLPGFYHGLYYLFFPKVCIRLLVHTSISVRLHSSSFEFDVRSALFIRHGLSLNDLI